MASHEEIDAFLASAQRRALKHAQFAIRDEHLAEDVVQDAMLRLVKNYADRPADELPRLFQRILQNAITDHFRREKVRGLWTTLVSALVPGRAETESDEELLDAIRADEGHWRDASAADQTERAQTLTIIENEIKKLPERQRQAFLMRYWEELDVAETAEAMGCSQGSVKTHCSRATKTLARALAARGIRL